MESTSSRLVYSWNGCMTINKLMLGTIGGIILIGYLSVSSFMLYELRKANTFLVEMAEYQANVIETISDDVQPIIMFRGLTSNRSFSCSIGLPIAP
jgi:hypothetical protein